MKIIRERNEWNSLLKQEFNKYQDVYFTYEYFELYRRHYRADLEGVFWEDENVGIFWQHLIRDVGKVKQFAGMKCYDLTTPYGYGGPLILTKDRQESRGGTTDSLKRFFAEYEEYALKSGYVCEFTRFHPIFENWKLLGEFTHVEHTNDTVVIDLNKSIDEILANMNKVTRRYIRKAQKEFEDVIVKDNPTDSEIETFLSLYYETMKKHNANEKYLFSYEFIRNHFDPLRSLLIFCRNKKNEIGSSAIFLRGSNLLHYHLGSTNYSFKYSPLRLVLWEAVKWAKESGFKYLHLGGGKGKNDGLFEFKEGFSKMTRPFYVGRKIFDLEKYRQLESLNPLSGEAGDFFPSYRKGLQAEIV